MRSDFPALELLLHVVTAREAVDWTFWKASCESLSETGGLTGLSPFEAARILDLLGHIEICADNEGGIRLSSAPAALAQLPRLGLPIAVLCGGRSPFTERKLEEAAINRVRLIKVHSSPERRNPPRAIFLEAETTEDLERVARETGIKYARVPPAWELTHVVGSLDDFLSEVRWRHEPEPEIPALEFTTETLQFGLPTRGAGGLRLLRYFPRKRAPYFELRDGERAARVDRDWGVYSVLRSLARNVLIYDSHANAVAIPISCPLPRLFARALGLCSGMAPVWLPAREASWPGPEAHGYTVYGGVASSIALTLFRKIGQAALPLHLPSHLLKDLHIGRHT